MKRFNRYLTILLAFTMILSYSLDASLLATYADSEPAAAEQAQTDEPSDASDKTAAEEGSSDAQKDAGKEQKAEKKDSAKKDKSKKTDSAKDSKDSKKSKEDKAKDTKDDTTADTVQQREIKAEIIQEALYEEGNYDPKDREEHKTRPYKALNRFWKSLVERKAVASEYEQKWKVIVSGELPEGITAQASFIPFDEHPIYTERGLVGLDVTLYDPEGNVFVPEKAVTVTLKGKALKSEITDENAPILYSWQEAKARAQAYEKEYKKDFYAADVRVFKSENVRKKYLNYKTYDKDKVYEDGEDAVRYKNDKDGLLCDKEEGSVSFELKYPDDPDSVDAGQPEKAATLHLVLSSQMDKRTLSATCNDAKITVKGLLDKDVKLEVTEITKKDSNYQDYLEQTAESLDRKASELTFARAFDIKLIDPATGKEFQPDSDVKVTIDLNDKKIKDEGTVEVVHFDTHKANKTGKTDSKTDKSGTTGNTGKAGKSNTGALGTPEVMDTKADGDSVEFTTEGFSVYVVAGTADIGEKEEVADKGETADKGKKEEQEDEEQTGGNETGQTTDQQTKVIEKRMVDLEGSWASWEIKINQDAQELNGGDPFVLKDTFTKNQSIKYASIEVEGTGVTYDYSGQTGTFMIPDRTAVTITYDTRVEAKIPGEVVNFGNTAVILRSEEEDAEEIGKAETSESHVIYPSASDVATETGTYMVTLYAYSSGSMQQGVPGAKFILLDENQKAMEYSDGDPVTFETDEDGTVDVIPDKTKGNIVIQKNTGYYLEMIQAPVGYKKDNTLYTFMITDDPGYNSGDFWTYYNGDTMKVRLKPESEGLDVSMRFSGNYELTEEQKNGIELVLQKQNGSVWEEVERHPYSDFTYGSMTFENGTSDQPFEDGVTYRVIQENQPWDLGETVKLSSKYYCVIGSGESEPANDPQTFTGEEAQGKSVNVVINNEYVEPKLTITKMDKETGAKLQGAKFTIRKFDGYDGDGNKKWVGVTDITSGSDGIVEIVGGDGLESEVLYFVEETVAPDDYYKPLETEKIYFYFCNDPDLKDEILKPLPEGEKAVNLSEDYKILTMDNQKQYRTIPVMVTWQDEEWPSEDYRVEVGLYKSAIVNGKEEKVKVLDDDGNHRTVVLSKSDPYNNRAFINLPTRDGDHNITYFIQEEHIWTTPDESTRQDVLDSYVQYPGISDAGVYTVRNKAATTLKIEKEWYDRSTNVKITDSGTLEQQSEVTFDVYQSTKTISDAVAQDGITYGEMAAFINAKENGAKKVRNDLQLSGTGDHPWEMTISDLDEKSDGDARYHYYVLESVPSFGEETYALSSGENDEQVATIKNKTAPETKELTVNLNVVDDPREETNGKPFNFTLTLKKGERAIRGYKVGEQENKDLVTDSNGQIEFQLKKNDPAHLIDDNIVLTLPTLTSAEGITATVEESEEPQFDEEAASATLTDLASEERVFRYDVVDDGTITFTNTLHVMCKVVDGTGTAHAFESLKSAFAYIRDNHDSAYVDGTATIELLENYEIPAEDFVDINGTENNTNAPENITITSARKDAGDNFPLTTAGDTATITRAGNGSSMIRNDGILTLKNIILDGGYKANPGEGEASFDTEADGAILYNTGTLNLGEKTRLQNSRTTGKGGAIYSSGVLNMAKPETESNENSPAITGNVASSGAAIYLEDGTFQLGWGRIQNNTGATDGAVMVENPSDSEATPCEITISGNPVVYGNTNSQGSPANLYIADVNSDTVINVASPGLDADAKIGVTAMDGHRELGEQFATAEFEVTDNLGCFINDLYDYRGKLKDGTSTNIVWDGLTLGINAITPPGNGANPNDTFTITLSSASIRKSNYDITGTLDYTITPADNNMPGTIEFRNVKSGDSFTVGPLPASSLAEAPNYTITEEAPNYNKVYTLKDDDSESDPDVLADGSFRLLGNSTVTVTNSRKTAPIYLTKSLEDRLAGNDAVPFNFDIKLTDTDGTAISGFALDGEAASCVTGDNGIASLTMSPRDGTTEADKDKKTLQAPVGATMEIMEKNGENYQITTKGTVPSSGEDITDQDTEHDNIFTCPVTEQGADISISNVRKMAHIKLQKNLEGKVSRTETFHLTATMVNSNGSKPEGYVMYRYDGDPSKYAENIVTNANGQASITFEFGENENSKEVELTIPNGTKLTVVENQEDLKRVVNGTPQKVYVDSVTINGASTTKAEIRSVKETDESIVFTNKRKTQTIKVTNTVSGYAGNVVPFTYHATVTDRIENNPDDYDTATDPAEGFVNGVSEFTLTTGQNLVLTVPYGAYFNIEQTLPVTGYETTIKRGTTNLGVNIEDEFQPTSNLTEAFTNTQLINLVLVNNTSNNLSNVNVKIDYATLMYRVTYDESGNVTGHVKLDDPSEPEYFDASTHTVTVSVEAGKTATLEVDHSNKQDYEDPYTVTGSTPAEGYYYTINNEPSFHESADPAIKHIYNVGGYELTGKLRYSVSDSTITFNEQPLVSYDVKGGAWTTEMEGYHDKDGIYQYAVNKNDKAPKPNPDPIYPTGENIRFLGWTASEGVANENHSHDDEDFEGHYDFIADSNKVTGPLTLYAVWKKDASEDRTVTLKNGTGDSLALSVTVTKDDTAVAGHTLMEGVVTGEGGMAQLTLLTGQSINLSVPDSAKLRLSPDPTSVLATSGQFTLNHSGNDFIIESVQRDGTVSFISGVCKITGADGNILYKNGEPAVYTTLAKAFEAYNGTGFTTREGEPANQTAVKMLIDEYPIEAQQAFPTKDVILTTAGKGDQDNFPYVGVRDRSTIYRGANFNDKCLFTHKDSATKVTLTKIILDGKEIKLAKAANGGLIHMNKAGAELNIEDGTTLRNVQYSDYSDGNNSRGGAVYVQNGTLNVKAGLFSNLHAYQGGAICVMVGGALSVTGTAGSIQFEDCSSERQDGGAIYYNRSVDLVIDGGDNKENPGIIFKRCVAAYTNGTGDGSDGGAIFATSNYSNTVTVKGCSFIECSARTGNSASTSGYGGGGICGYKVKGLTVLGCKFEACDTLCGGGAVAAIVKTTNTIENETVTISSCAFEQCNSKSQAGALAVYQDNNGASGSATKLSVIDSEFNGCSSGTNNGSGGAIQCYLPCMVFSGSRFTDCWAGKEGGAINNFFAGKYGDMWANSSLTLTGCTFTRCRAEDRYQAEQPQHYGGALNAKVKTATVSNCTFTDCVSTLREGGALHLGGIGDSSKATITASTFKNCMAKTGGGAVMTSAETLKVEASYFFGCQAFGKHETNYKYDNANKKNQNGGGAISHSENSRNTSTQNTTEIINCVFKADQDGGEDAQSCSTATNGGAIWTRAKTVSITSCSIDGCAAADKGGAIYLAKNGDQNATISSGSIAKCTAVNGSAVYAEGKATFSGAIVGDNDETDDIDNGNICADINSGAIHCGDTGKLYFEGNTIVKGNTYSGDNSAHNVALPYNNDTTIYTTAVGLSEEAEIGVYTKTGDPYNNHGKEGQTFGTWINGNGNAYLDSFVNDRQEGLYGYQSATRTDDDKIYWGSYICKITDTNGNTLKRTNGRDARYQRVALALNEFTQVKDDNGNLGKAVYIKMLIENYNLTQTEQIENFPEANVTLTTESYTGTERVEGKYDGKNPYRGTEGTVCTISRANSTNQLFKLNTAAATFQLENIILDGRKDKTAGQGDFRLIEVADGSLIVNGGTTFQYGHSVKGGAICISSSGATLEVHSSENADMVFDHCTQHSTAKGTGGGAIYAKSSVTIDNSNGGQVRFESCSADRGGAIMLNENTGAVSLSVTGAEFKSCHSNTEGGAIFHNNYTNVNTSTTISNSSFDSCYSNRTLDTGSKVWCYGGAVHSKTAYLTVNGCNFKNCHTVSNGGAISHGTTDEKWDPEKGIQLQTIITDTTFEDCYTEECKNGEVTEMDFSYGGSVYTFAKEVQISGSTFKNSKASNHGGALYCKSNDGDSAATISGTTFEACSSSRSDNNACGGAIYCRNKTLTLQDYSESGKPTKPTVITNCTAIKRSGAIYMETVGSELNVQGNTQIIGCYANEGGAIYLKEDVTMNITETPEFSKNGYYTQDNETVVEAENGACIYLEQGSTLNLSGAPKFSRNNLPKRAKVTNGGITDFVRQDVYMAGYSGDGIADSIHVTGELTGDTIWIWPKEYNRRLPNDQFAVTRDDKNGDEYVVSADSLKKLRNAWPDGSQGTGCSNGEYLTGVRHPDGAATYVYWDKMYNISFMKKDNKAVGVAGAEFTLFQHYSDGNLSGEVATERSADGINDKNSLGERLDLGTVDFANIPIGVYYMKETDVPDSFKQDTPETNTVYLVLVGSPYLSPNENYAWLWTGDGPLAVNNAEDLIAKSTTNNGKYFGVFPLSGGDKPKADLTRNLADKNVGIINIRDDVQAWFMKVDQQGNALPGAEFTVYTNLNDQGVPAGSYGDGYPKLRPWTRDGAIYSAKSADGSSNFKDVDGKTLRKGLVYFRELPSGTYYLMESEYPVRNGNNRKTFYVETDRVFKLVVNGKDDFEISEWNENGSDEAGWYSACNQTGDPYKGNSTYQINNTEAVCKLTDRNNNLLYTLGHDGKTRLPAVYSSLKAGFDAAQSTEKALYKATGDAVANSELNPDLKLKALKDLDLTEPVTYTSSRNLTLTTADRNATTADKYTFVTTRTRDTSQAIISHAFNGTMITISGGAGMTLENIKLEGKKSNHTGRAVTIENESSLNVNNKATIQNFKISETGENSAKGGAVLVKSGANLTVNGGNGRTAQFINNEVVHSNGGTSMGGAIALETDCDVTIKNAQFTGNKATGEKGKGGALNVGSNSLTLTNVVFSGNEAGKNGGAISLGTGGELTLKNSTLQKNKAPAGSAVYGCKESEITVSGSVIRENRATAANGGAINVGKTPEGGTVARIWFEGKTTVYDNLASDGKSQSNVVLAEDSNEIIRTTDQGLKPGGKIGVYVIDELMGAHGIVRMPFGTFVNNANVNVFKNDRNEALYGVLNDKDTDHDWIYWGGIEGERRVVLRKVKKSGEKYEALNDKTFTICTGNTEMPMTVGKETLEGLKSSEAGVIWVGNLPYGTYTLYEGNVKNPEATFTLNVGEKGVTDEKGDVIRELKEN